MPRRTSINDYVHIERSDDLSRIVKDKRQTKRASKEKAKRRNRHYVKVLLSKFKGSNEGLLEGG